jgi:hypothetical protein
MDRVNDPALLRQMPHHLLALRVVAIAGLQHSVDRETARALDL